MIDFRLRSCQYPTYSTHLWSRNDIAIFCLIAKARHEGTVLRILARSLVRPHPEVALIGVQAKLSTAPPGFRSRHHLDIFRLAAVLQRLLSQGAAWIRSWFRRWFSCWFSRGVTVTFSAGWTC